MSVPAIYTDSQVLERLRTSVANSAGDYKCIVTYFFFGAMDTHNVLIPKNNNGNAGAPTNNNNNYNVYNTVRPEGVRMEQAPGNTEVIDLGIPDSEPNKNFINWTINDRMPFLANLWNGTVPNWANSGSQGPAGGALAFVHDTGILSQITTRDDYLAPSPGKDFYNPPGLFAHNTQQLLWQAADFGRGTGWFGRTANFIKPIDQTPDFYFNPDEVPTCSAFTLSGSDLQSRVFTPLANVSFPPALLNDPRELNTGLTPGQLREGDRQMRDTDTEGNTLDDPDRINPIINSIKEVFNTADVDQQTTSDALFTWENDNGIDQPTKDRLNGYFDTALSASGQGDGTIITSWIEFARSTAKIIYSAAKAPAGSGYQQRRQTIFVPFGGWDHHSELRLNLNIRLRTIDKSLEALVSFLSDPAIDLFDQVTIMHGSDFGRTLRSNVNKGTDHAWASHHFILGGAITRGFYPTGYYPNYTIEGGGATKTDGSPLGRFIPEVAVDQVYAEVLQWFGVPAQDTPVVLPQLNNFVVMNGNFAQIGADGNIQHRFASLNTDTSGDFKLKFIQN